MFIAWSFRIFPDADAVFFTFTAVYFLYHEFYEMVKWALDSLIDSIKYRFKIGRRSRCVPTSSDDDLSRIRRAVANDPFEDEDKYNSNPFEIDDYASRNFLNLSSRSSPAIIQCRIEDGQYHIEIRDCNGMVLLHGSVRSDDAIENGLHKCDTLINEVMQMRNWLAWQRGAFDENQKSNYAEN